MSDKKPEEAKPAGDAKPAAEAPAASGGIKSWLPLLIAIVAMPALAIVTTKFLILPKILHAREGAGEHEEAAEEGHGDAGHDAKGDKDKGHGESAKPEKGDKGEKGKEAKGKKQTAQFSKIIVNVSGSMGSRYLMTSLTVVGSRANFKEVIEENKDQLLDLANSALASRNIADLEKPGARNQIRSELMSLFNNALGGNVIHEIYFTEFAIQ